MRSSLQLFAAACLLTLFFVATPAQSPRLTNLSQVLDEQALDLAERTYGDYRTRSFSNRSDVEALYLAQQFSASARVFRRMVSDRRRESELKDGAAILSGLLSRADSRSRWVDVRRTFEDIQRALEGRGEGGGSHEGVGEATSGRLHWRGTVDDNVQLVIRDGYVDVRTIGGTEYSDANYNFTSPLPRRRITVRANKLNGRGTVRVLQQPSRENDFTAVIEIKDSGGGARIYEIEVLW